MSRYLCLRGRVGGKRCPYLLLSLLGVLLVYPSLLDRPHTEALLVVLNTTVVSTAIYAVSDARKHLLVAVLIGIPQLVLSWHNVYQLGKRSEMLQSAVTAGFYSHPAASLLRRSRPRGSDRIPRTGSLQFRDTDIARIWGRHSRYGPGPLTGLPRSHRWKLVSSRSRRTVGRDVPT
jgi:hypothetical protein